MDDIDSTAPASGNRLPLGFVEDIFSFIITYHAKSHHHMPLKCHGISYLIFSWHVRSFHVMPSLIISEHVMSQDGLLQ